MTWLFARNSDSGNRNFDTRSQKLPVAEKNWTVKNLNRKNSGAREGGILSGRRGAAQSHDSTSKCAQINRSDSTLILLTFTVKRGIVLCFLAVEGLSNSYKPWHSFITLDEFTKIYKFNSNFDEFTKIYKFNSNFDVPLATCSWLQWIWIAGFMDCNVVSVQIFTNSPPIFTYYRIDHPYTRLPPTRVLTTPSLTPAPPIPSLAPNSTLVAILANIYRRLN
jgi:hypothetical protein